MQELREAGSTQIGFLVDFGSLAQRHIMGSLGVFPERMVPHVRSLQARAATGGD
jgi:hypothetical protein